MQKYGSDEQVTVERDRDGAPLDPQGIQVTAGDHVSFTEREAHELAAENREVDES